MRIYYSGIGRVTESLFDLYNLEDVISMIVITITFMMEMFHSVIWRN